MKMVMTMKMVTTRGSHKKKTLISIVGLMGHFFSWKFYDTVVNTSFITIVTYI